jgi:hypothetical protein
VSIQAFIFYVFENLSSYGALIFCCVGDYFLIPLLTLHRNTITHTINIKRTPPHIKTSPRSRKRSIRLINITHIQHHMNSNITSASKAVNHHHKPIPLTLSTAAGERLYVLENEAYHSGKVSGGGCAAKPSSASHSQGVGKKKSHSGTSPMLPEMTPSLADFSVVTREEVAPPRKARIDESEWVVVTNE